MVPPTFNQLTLILIVVFACYYLCLFVSGSYLSLRDGEKEIKETVEAVFNKPMASAGIMVCPEFCSILRVP